MSCTQTCFKSAVVVGLIAALTPGLWAQSLQQRQTLTPLGGTDAPPTAQAQGGLLWFTNQSDFIAFNLREGNDLKGIEDFEESILPPAEFDIFDDPLKFGVRNSPDGFPFPIGLTGLPNLIVQSNLGGGNPTVPNPRGVDGLQALSVGGGFPVASDVVRARIFPDSFDLIFTNGKSGVGFKPLGDIAVEVRVYSTGNVFLEMMTTPADPLGKNFIGVWSSVDPIGRINIFGPGDAREGADNIQAWVEGTPGPCQLAQLPNQINGFFSDTDCNICDQGPIQILADNFHAEEFCSIGAVEIFGGYFPNGHEPIDNFTVNIHEDDAGLPGAIINSWTGPATQTPTGVVVFGVPEIKVTIVMNQFSLPSGDLWVSVFNDTSGDSDSWFWETAFVDPFHGIPGIASRFELPSSGGWFFGATFDLAITLLPPPCPWDLDGSGIVGATDLLSLLVTWGPCDDCNDCPADFDGNCTVGATDLLALLVNWGPCP